MSPRARPSAMSFNNRRMILPLRVFGRSAEKRMSSGFASAPADPEPLQHVGEFVHLDVQLAVRDAPHLSGRLPFPDQGDPAGTARTDVAVEAVRGGVELPTQKPLGVRRLPLEHAIPRTDPFELLGPVRPVTFGIATRPLIRGLVAHVGCSPKILRRGEAALLVEEGFDAVGRHVPEDIKEEGSLASCAARLAMRQGAA